MKVPVLSSSSMAELELQFAVLNMAITKLDRMNALILIWTILRCCSDLKCASLRCCFRHRMCDIGL